MPDTRTPVRQILHSSSSSSRIVDRAPSNDPQIMYLGLPQSQLAALKQYGTVAATIPDSQIDRITISDQNVPKAAPKVDIQPYEMRGDALVFRFTEYQLAHLNDNRYEFDVPDNLKGRISKAIIEYPPALERVSNQTRSNTSRVGTGFESQDPRWRLAGDTTVDPNVRQDQRANNSRLAELERQRELQRQAELDRQRNLVGQRDFIPQRDLIGQRDSILQRDVDPNRAAYDQWLKDKEARDKLALEDHNRQLQNELDRLRIGQQQQAIARNQQLTFPPDRFASNPYAIAPALLPQTPIVQPTTSDSLAVSMRFQQIENRLAQLTDERRRLENQVKTVTAENDTLLRRFDYGTDSRTDNRRDLPRTERIY